MTVSFGIVTPTYNRRVLLRRHLRRAAKQSYPHWRLFVVHDGPNSAVKSSVENIRCLDERIAYLETERATNDAGVTPRLEGARAFLAAKQTPDYLLFWDDDNSYSEDVLDKIALSLERAKWPDVLIARVNYRSQIVPPENALINSLDVGEIDTACLILRPRLAQDAYASVQALAATRSDDVWLSNDFLVYRYLNELRPQISISFDPQIVVGRHDGLRWGPFIRHALGIKPLGLARRFGLGR